MTTDFLLFKECWVMSILFLVSTCYNVSLCSNATNHYLNPRELRRLGVALLSNKRIWHLVKTESVSVPWQFAKHSGISQMILADCLWSDVEVFSV